MGRVVPVNAGRNLITRLLDLERSGGYQVDQQARMNLGMVPQYGGTVGGIRMRALKGVGGWDDELLAEDTDLTYRLLLADWKTVYQNRAECYEEVPETWPVRIRQIQRWARGHNQAMVRHLWRIVASRRLTMAERIDGLGLLGVYLMAPLLVLGWLLAMVVFYAGGMSLAGGAVTCLAVASFGAFGNFAAFFEIAAAALLDGSRHRLRLLPFNLFGFFVSAVSIAVVSARQVASNVRPRRELRWDKTERFRRSA
jgi:cellulose synthase/poly-beta-1,6-N-acetylglucosamine synthase-like glycosyltransferase